MPSDIQNDQADIQQANLQKSSCHTSAAQPKNRSATKTHNNFTKGYFAVGDFHTLFFSFFYALNPLPGRYICHPWQMTLF